MGERLRVLFVTAWFPNSRSPMEGVFVREHARAVQIYDDVAVLHVAGHDPTVKGLFRLEEEHNASLTAGLPTIRSSHHRLPFPGLSAATYGAGAMAAVRRLEQRGFRPDIVHAHVYSAGRPAALIAGWRHLPLVLTEHSSAFPRRLLTARQVRLARQIMARAARVMPVSQALQRGIEDYGIRATFQVIPNVVDLAVFHPTVGDQEAGAMETTPMPEAAPDTRHCLLFVGGLTPIKGTPDLLAALATLNQTRRDWRLEVVGDGAQRAECAALVARLDLSDQVRFHGFQPKSVVATFMRQADFLVLPSLWENSPCVIIEAMASGLPVIASRVGGIPELVTEDTGILTPPGDPALLAAALAQALQQPDRFERRRLASKARRYEPAVVGRDIDAVYREVLK
ncbi:MAG TPA: glycosyltransferase [Anaerolineae bacterium]|nr:glycosyltransferase [Anaerolineae bacterium]